MQVKYVILFELISDIWKWLSVILVI